MLAPRRSADPTRTVREQLLVEITGEPIPCADTAGQTGGQSTVGGRHVVADLLELNRLFTAWVETVYHRRVHSETGQPPLARWSAGGPFPLPTPVALAEAFRWEERRTVTKTATVSLHGNTYQVDPALAGRRVELVFDPFDLTTVAVRLGGVPAGTAVPHRIGRHAHPKARPETPPPPPAATGINYARLVDTTHQGELAGGVNYAALAHRGSDSGSDSSGQLPGQLDLLTGRPVDLDTPHGDTTDLNITDQDTIDVDTTGGDAVIDRLQGSTGSPAPRSAATSPPECCTATPRTARPWPGSAGASPNAGSG